MKKKLIPINNRFHSFYITGDWGFFKSKVILNDIDNLKKRLPSWAIFYLTEINKTCSIAHPEEMNPCKIHFKDNSLINSQKVDTK